MLDGIRLIDFHTHILPQMDDGSQSVSESVQMLHTLSDAHVSCVVLTPHFYANIDSPSSFLTRRNNAYAQLKDALAADDHRTVPGLLLGAEVEYFEGISVIEELRAFQFGASRCLLLEMPPGPWTSRMVDDILDLNNRHDCRVILAHVERYLFDQSEDTVNTLLLNHVMMQSNAEFFLNRRTVSRAIRFLNCGLIHLLGSDCHNTSTRPPNIGKAAEVIVQRAGEESLKKMMHAACSLLLSEHAAGHE